MLRYWNLPESIIQAAECHHGTECSITFGKQALLISAVVSMANHTVPLVMNKHIPPIDKELLNDPLGIDEFAVQQLLVQTRGQWQQAVQILYSSGQEQAA